MALIVMCYSPTSIEILYGLYFQGLGYNQLIDI